MTTMPAAFVGHGNPMNALEQNRFTDAWRQFGASSPRPRAILAVSAHWYVNASVLTAMSQPRTIHDFYGFPQELFDVEYPAVGSPEIAAEIAEVVKPTWVGLDQDSWGIDHGTWSVLVHAFPKADVPVIQLSIDASKPMEYHLELGAELAALRESGIMIIASGNIVHNLRLVQWREPDAGFDWARRFDLAAQEVMVESPELAVRLAQHDDYDLASPTPDHFLPLLYLAGLASLSDEKVGVMVEGCVMGSLSMTSLALGLGS
jgi:4,5-DOPA dioxygenase extradiol